MGITRPIDPVLPSHRPGIDYETGRLWIPGAYIPDDVDGDGVYGAPDFGAALNCCPYTKYMFVAPTSNYDMQEFIDWRADNYAAGLASVTTTAGFVFFMGDSSDCGGTIIQHDPTDPTQAFVRSADTIQSFVANEMTRGGFFLLGDRQGVGAAATQIKRIFFDCHLDFLVLAVHRKSGEINTDISVTALRHLIASLRWDLGPKVPILVMLGDENTNHHLMSESERDTLFVGDVTAQSTREEQITMCDRYGFLGLNFWPIMAFLPNTENGPSVETSMTNMSSRLFHPMLVPAASSGCPFNTARQLLASEMVAARARFESTTMAPLANPKVRTTSVWFWDFDTVKSSSTVRGWRTIRHLLDGNSDNLDYVSDLSVAWISHPVWVGHPVYDKPFAIELAMEPRSGPPNQLAWIRDKLELEEDDLLFNTEATLSYLASSGAGNIPALHGAKDFREGWVTVVTPFELSPTASAFYARDVFPGDPRGVPVIPPYVNFSWMLPVTQEAITEAEDGEVKKQGWFDILGNLIDSIIDAAVDALEYIPDQLGLLSDTNDADFIKWSAGLYQPEVVLYGTAEWGGAETQGTDLNVAPFAVQIQTINIEMNGELGFVWPGHVFNVIPIHLGILETFNLDLSSTFLDDWDDLVMDVAGRGTTPLNYSMDANIREVVESQTTLRIPKWSELEPDLDAKGDFPPMLDKDDPTLSMLPGSSDAFTGRDFSNHLARIDITHPRVLRVRENNFGGGSPGSGGVQTQGMLTHWPIEDDRQIRITRGYSYRDASLYSCGGLHGGLDLVYADGSASRNTTIRAAGGGIVSRVDVTSLNGPFVEITHSIGLGPTLNTFRTHYLHLSNIVVEEGDAVSGGEMIGTMGGDQPGEGASSGLHLHFGITKRDHCDKLNPCDELPAPANGIIDENGDTGCGATSPELLIWRAFNLVAPGATLTDQCGDTILRADMAVAIAKAESSLKTDSDGHNKVAGLTVSIDRGLFQINSGWVQGFTEARPMPLVAAGIISEASIERFSGPGYSGEVWQSTDLLIPSVNIAAALFISQNGSTWTAWATYTQQVYREKLGLATC